MDEPSMESSTLLNLRIINHFVAIFTASAVGWMSTGEYLLRPVCNKLIGLESLTQSRHGLGKLLKVDQFQERFYASPPKKEEESE